MYASPNDSISPVIKGETQLEKGLTKREYFAAMAMQGIISNSSFNYGEFAIIRQEAGSNAFKISVKELIERDNVTCINAKGYEINCKVALVYADELIEQLNKLKTES